MTASGRARAPTPRRWRAPRAPRLRAEARRATAAWPSRARLGEALAQARVARVDVHARTGLGVHHRQSPDARQLGLAWVANLHSQQRVARAERLQRPRPFARVVREVGDQHHQGPQRGKAANPRQRLRQRLPGHAVGGHALREGAAQSDPRPAASARRDQPGLRRAVVDERHSSAPAHRERTQDVDHSLGHVALEAIGGPEGHGGRHVEGHPGGQQPLRHALADVGDAVCAVAAGSSWRTSSPGW